MLRSEMGRSGSVGGGNHRSGERCRQVRFEDLKMSMLSGEVARLASVSVG
jgi:hypothetical protein